MDLNGSLWCFHSIHVFREKLITAAVAQLSGSAAPAEGADDGADEPVDKEVAMEVARRVTMSSMSSVTGPGGSGILKEGELSKQGGKTTHPSFPGL